MFNPLLKVIIIVTAFQTVEWILFPDPIDQPRNQAAGYNCAAMFEAATDREIRVGCDGGLLLTDAGTLFSNEKKHSPGVSQWKKKG